VINWPQWRKICGQPVLTAKAPRGTVIMQRFWRMVMPIPMRMGFVLALATVLTGADARAASFFEKNFWLSGPRYDGVMPACDDQWALSKIALRFAQKEGRFWNSSLQILGFERVRQTAYRPWASDTIPRRFCTAVALVSDGLRHPVHYWIGEDTGMIGQTWGVEWCVVGLDRNWAYNPACKMARP
jgi:hypothetical protein